LKKLICSFKKILNLLKYFSDGRFYKQVITIEPGKRGGKPCIRGMCISVNDALGWLASGMTIQDILNEFVELTENDIYAAINFKQLNKHV
jgi:uncharacterized protein (DUF433 family)